MVENPLQGIMSLRNELAIPLSLRKKILNNFNSLLKQAVSRARGVTIPEKESIEASVLLQDVGKDIFRYMVPKNIREYLSQINIENLIISTEDSEIPWELMHNGRDFFCLQYSMGRRIQTHFAPRKVSRPKHKTLRVLFFANPTGDLPQAEKEAKIIEKILEKDTEFCAICGEEANLINLLEHFGKTYFNVFHYAGHIKYNQSDPENSLISLADEEISVQYLLNTIETPPQVVFMNACESAHMEEIEHLNYGRRITGVADVFISAGVDAYIGTLFPVEDKVALDISQIFYRFLLEGKSIGTALRLAKLLASKKHLIDLSWAAFILYGEPSLKIFGYRKSKEYKKEKQYLQTEKVKILPQLPGFIICMDPKGFSKEQIDFLPSEAQRLIEKKLASEKFDIRSIEALAGDQLSLEDVIVYCENSAHILLAPGTSALGKIFYGLRKKVLSLYNYDFNKYKESLKKYLQKFSQEEQRYPSTVVRCLKSFYREKL